MPVIRTCANCQQKNRIPAKHLADTGRCGSCKSPLPPAAEPLAVDAALFDEITQNATSRSSSTSGLRMGMHYVETSVTNPFWC